MWNFNKKYQLTPDSLCTAKEAGKIADVKPNRIHYFREAKILIPKKQSQKGDGLLTYTHYDPVNVLEIFLINKLSSFFIPKRIIKDFFESIRENRDVLNPFRIRDYGDIAFLLFFHDADGNLKHWFISKSEDWRMYGAVNLVVDLKQLVAELFERIEQLP